MSLGRGSRLASIAVLVLLVLGAAGCTAAPAGRVRASAQACWQFSVRAVRARVVVRSVPPACAGLGPAELDQIVVSAVREAIGPAHKAAGRRQAVADARYLGDLIRPAGRPHAAPVEAAATGPASPAGAGQGLAALAVWAATAGAGLTLLLRHRARPLPTAAGHGIAAVAGLGVWTAYCVTSEPALAWVAAGIVAAASGLGMAVLATTFPADETVPLTVSGGPARTRRLPVLVIAGHVVPAVTTMLLVVLAATGSG